MAKAKKEPGFEESLQRLEEIVERLEDDDLELEQSLALFEEGVKLATACNLRLDEAEKKVALLLKNNEGALVEAPFDQDEEE
ncbi:MAG: exodeoxyribonuclease VII small subunit [Desulfarculus sp.]|nr:exodeoxyribonuclease VII small subunit [Pseudomonadota bacterium]MBV1714575.1 exodeoxyribonuclease VII small subunit [Desulfarculus sp.]MCG2763274.1 exodeoxyribonuclease VII small subunit [Desulfarculaceae bacterium]MBU4382986.1 exodeoxyribonuclease VII small subunit [Pseudomonadota bacterium]MBU4564664.1 exodeoxyribonuclease VII small subunit [Pseudomonadota bacterium]